MNNNNIMVRGIVQNNDKDAAVATVRNLKIYPLSESSNPKPNKFTTMSGKDSNTLPPKGIEFWERLSAVIGLLPDVPDLLSQGRLVRRDLEAGRCRVGEMTVSFDSSPMFDSREECKHPTAAGNCERGQKHQQEINS